MALDCAVAMENLNGKWQHRKTQQRLGAVGAVDPPDPKPLLLQTPSFLTFSIKFSLSSHSHVPVCDSLPNLLIRVQIRRTRRSNACLSF